MCFLTYRSSCKALSLAVRRMNRHQATRGLQKATKGTLKIGPARAALMTALGQKQTFAAQNGMSALRWPHRPGPSRTWIKVKNPKAPGAEKNYEASFCPLEEA